MKDIFSEIDKNIENLLFTLEGQYMEQLNRYRSQINVMKIISIITMSCAVSLPIITWLIVLKNIDNDDASKLTVFAFTGMTLASVLVIIFVTLLRRSQAIEKQAIRIDDLIDKIRKKRIACLAKYALNINEYINYLTGKNLIMQSSSNDEADEDEIKAATSLLGELQKIISPGRPKLGS